MANWIQAEARRDGVIDDVAVGVDLSGVQALSGNGWGGRTWNFSEYDNYFTRPANKPGF